MDVLGRPQKFAASDKAVVVSGAPAVDKEALLEQGR
jgi:hypothetical protein